MLWKSLRNWLAALLNVRVTTKQSNLDDREIAFKCPKCHGEIRKTIGWLKANHSLTCTGCGTTMELHTEQVRNPTNITFKFKSPGI
jgi:transcription elongation factor Elf1